MARLRPPGGRRAAAVTQEPQNETNLEGQNPERLDEVGVEDEHGVNAGADPTAALREQIEALRRSERDAILRAETERQRAEDALKRAQERDLEVNKLQEQTVNSQKEAIDAAISAAQSEADTAQREIEAAASIGDAKGQADAYRKLSRAEARMVALESGKDALEREVRERPQPLDQPRATDRVDQSDPIEKLNLPPLAKQWLKKNPEFLYDQRKNARIQSLHWDVVDDGYEPYSKDYFEAMEEKLGMRRAVVKTQQEPEEEEMEEEQPAPRRGTISAPPSREVPSSNGTRDGGGRITLTVAQKEAAKIAGISEKEYAEQMIRLRKEKANGNYGGAP